MCGIVYVHRKDKKPAYKSVLKRYRAQSHRGIQGFGYIAIKNGVVVSYQRSALESEIVRLIAQEDAEEILFHHRFPTSTPNIDESAHPLLVQHESFKDNYFIVHNGVIINTDKLHAEHEKLGFKYTTEIEKGFTTAKGVQFVQDTDWNDSESIAIETALALEKKQKTIDSVGAAAIICIRVDGNGKVLERVAYHNARNPLKYVNDDIMTTLTSEGKGEDVRTIFVQKMNQDGSMTDYEGFIPTPLSYHAYAPKGSDYDYTGYASSAHGASTQPALPMGKTGGFRETLTPEEKAARAADEESAFDPDEDTFISNVKSIKEILSLKNVVKFLSEDDSWKEYEVCHSAIRTLSEQIDQFDTRIEAADRIDESMANDRLTMGNALDALKKHEKELEAHITAYETRNIRSADRVFDDTYENEGRTIGF